jgi:signal transduction histidine kinase
MIHLVSDLQDSTQIHTGKLQICLEPADLVALVASVVAEQRLVHPCRVFQVALPQRDAVIALVDAGRIRQVLTNYLSNAVKYTPAVQPIAIHLSVADTMIRVDVRDHGPGLGPAQQARIWERFQQGDAHEGGAAATGLGLGLHISRVIVEQHAGCVGVASVPGQGATFWFEIPRAGAALLPEECVDTPALRSPPTLA